MAKISAFGTSLTMGICQVETSTVVGTVVNPGNLHVVCTSALIAGSPLQTVVAVLALDSADTVATKIRTALNLVAAITLNFIVGGSGPLVTLTAKVAAADEAALNIDYHMDTGTGLTDDLTSVTTTAGSAPVAIAYVTNIGGPGLGLDTVDVTTHDQATAWEEDVATLLRSGEVKVDIVYDPNNATHNAATGLVTDSTTLTYFQLIFPGPYTWSFSGYVTGFEPSESVDGALTSAVTIKITGAPSLV